MESSRAALFAVGVAVGAAVSLLLPVLFSSTTARAAPTGSGDGTASSRSSSRGRSLSTALADRLTMTSSVPTSAQVYGGAAGGLYAMEDPLLAKLEQEFRIHTSMLHAIVKKFISELTKGLKEPGQTIKALPSFVTKRPNGSERGTFLALDLGGTNLRVCEVTLEGHGKFRMRQKKYTVSDEVKVSTAKVMFDFIAAVVDEFLSENRIQGGRKGEPALKLGFTFSYPVDQTALDVGTLMHWNKGFDVKGVVGKDVVGLLRQAFERKGLNIDVVAVVNDTVGTLVAHAYEDPETYVGVIIGTGSNAAYVEKIDNIPKWTTHYDAVPVPTGEMIVNIEWGAFDNEKTILPVTCYDEALDNETENCGKQVLEKMISGLYLGEIARLVLKDLTQKGLLFQGVAPPRLQIPYGFETQYMSRIERDHSMDLSDTSNLLEDLLGVKDSTLLDRQIVKRVCELVGIRSARLSAAAIAGVLSKMNRLNGCTVAIDGSVFEHYPHYKNRMADALREIFGVSADNVKLCLARDGSGVGAALIAAVMGDVDGEMNGSSSSIAADDVVTEGAKESPKASPKSSPRISFKSGKKKRK